MKNRNITLVVLFSVALSVLAQDQKPKVPKGYWNMTTLKIAYVLGKIDLIEKDPVVPDNLNFMHDLTYNTTDSGPIKLDIAYPKNMEEPAPLLVFVYGEAWTHGNKEKYKGYLIDFANKGYVTASVWYRKSAEAPFPAAVEDVKCAVNWLAANADKFHIDTDNVALVGASSGGYLALMTAYSPDNSLRPDSCSTDKQDYKIQAVVSSYAPVDLTDKRVIKSTKAEQFIGVSYDQSPELYRKASPVSYITKNIPPTLIFHGSIDDVVSIKQSEALKVKLESFGVPVEYHKLKGMPHFMEGSKDANNYMLFYMTDFFAKYLE